jgi:hypothetical protein
LQVIISKCGAARGFVGGQMRQILPQRLPNYLQLLLIVDLDELLVTRGGVGDVDLKQ